MTRRKASPPPDESEPPPRKAARAAPAPAAKASAPGSAPRGTRKARSTQPEPAPAPPRRRISRRLVVGILLLAVVLVYSLPFLVPDPGGGLFLWVRSNRQLLGWGVYALPVTLVYFAALLIRDYLVSAARASWRWALLQLIGGVLVFLSLLGLIHAFALSQAPGGVVYINPALLSDPDPNLVWRSAVACPANPTRYLDRGWIPQAAYLDAQNLAECGYGGGYAGAALQTAAWETFGTGVGSGVLAGALIVGAALTIGARIAGRRAVARADGGG